MPSVKLWQDYELPLAEQIICPWMNLMCGMIALTQKNTFLKVEDMKKIIDNWEEQTLTVVNRT